MSETPVINQRETVNCPLCGADRAETLFIARDRLVGMPGEFPIVMCEGCGLVYLNPRPTMGALSAYYPTEYYPLSEGRETPEAISVARGLLERVESIARGQEISILDVGCGTGLFLKLARDRGNQVRGIELSQSAVEYGRQIYGLDIESGTLESAAIPDETFDIVTMWHVLEHTPDPVAALQTVHRTLKPGGTLLFGVPNIGSLEAKIFGRRWFSLDAPRHLVHFAPDTAVRAVAAAGLDVTEVVHSAGVAGLTYSVMGDLTGISLKIRGSEMSPAVYHRMSGAVSWIVWPVCWLAARMRMGGAIEVYARKVPA